MIKKGLRTLLSMALAASMLCSNVAMAESQVETVTYGGKDVKCTLVCDWSLFSNDSATAKTNWTGKGGYQVKVILYSRQEMLMIFVRWLPIMAQMGQWPRVLKLAFGNLDPNTMYITTQLELIVRFVN